jgi:hypothetical protein
MNRNRLIAQLSVIFLLAGTILAQEGAPSSKEALIISGFADHPPLTLKAADLKTLTHIKVTIHNPHSNADETYAGARLSDLLGKVGAPLGSDLRGKALADYVVATGSDGYRTVLALAEIDPAFHPGEVIVSDEMNGKPLDDHNGPMKLVVTEDRHPARWVRNLVKIEVKTVP